MMRNPFTSKPGDLGEAIEAIRRLQARLPLATRVALECRRVVPDTDLCYRLQCLREQLAAGEAHMAAERLSGYRFTAGEVRARIKPLHAIERHVCRMIDLNRAALRRLGIEISDEEG